MDPLAALVVTIGALVVLNLVERSGAGEADGERGRRLRPAPRRRRTGRP